MGQNNTPPQQQGQQPPPQYQGPPQQYPPQYPQGYPPPPPPPPQVVYIKKRSACLPIFLIAVAIIVVLGIVGALATPKTGTTIVTTAGNTPKPNVPAAANTPAPAPSMAKIGDTVAVGDWQVMVEKMETSTGFDYSGFKNMQTPKGIYVLIYETATNVSAKTSSVNSFDYKLVDSTGASFDSCGEFSCYEYPGQLKRDSFNAQVPPRTATKLLAIFDVAPHAKGLVLTIEDNTKIAIGDTP